MDRAVDLHLQDPKLVEVRDAWFNRLEDFFQRRIIKGPFYVNGVTGQSPTNRYREPERWVYECLADLAHNADALLDPGALRLLVVESALYGVHFIDRIFGAHVYATEHGWWSDTLTTPVGSLAPPDLDCNATWQLAQTIAKAFLASKATVPVLGLPTIANSLNIAVNLYGAEFLIALLDNPQAARHDLQVINQLLCNLHRWYLTHIPLKQLQPVIAARRTQPPGYGQLCGCTTHLLSAKQYEEHVADLDNALLAVYPHGGMIHLCGVHTQHIPVWRDMPALKAVQLNDRAADDLAAYHKNLRDDQIIYVRPYAGMNMARIMSITGGERVVIMGESPKTIRTAE